MGKDCGYWIHRKHSPWQSPDLNYTRITPLELGRQNGQPLLFSAYANPCLYMVSASGTVPGFTSYESVRANEAQVGYYSYQNEGFNPTWNAIVRANEAQVGRYQNQGFNPTRNAIIDKKLYVAPCDSSKAILDSTPSRFLGFDQSGGKISLSCSSAGHPNWLNVEMPKEVAPIFQPLPVIPNSNYDDSGKKGTEMHEDTEEIDALLYSDSDEETSTGHSPSEIGFERKEQGSEMHEEVASSTTPNKRRRLDGEGDKSLIDTASSAKAHSKLYSYDDSSSANEASLENKRMRKERIKETVRILRSVIPGGKRKDAVTVIDEAIRYLRTLGMKANALGATL
eukprot:TRINITY_DN653_c0_g1_i1.p1 TRINITY_DN653_c0_g1~~TRINITY_DN653_c0_g1_i1.p1  ORF type:complete len:339 (-),score=47.23 TRINITY_DN653_c0_g1_i1:731-1747(-)